jgi:hypothetical protein
MEDPITHYEYGPEIPVKRYQYAESYVKPSERAKFRVFTHQNDEITHLSTDL